MEWHISSKYWNQALRAESHTRAFFEPPSHRDTSARDTCNHATTFTFVCNTPFKILAGTSMLRIGYTSNCLLVCFLLHTCTLTIDSPPISFPTSARTWPFDHRRYHDLQNLVSPTAAGSTSTSELSTDILSRCGPVRWRQSRNLMQSNNLCSTTLLLLPETPRSVIAQKRVCFCRPLSNNQATPYT